MERATVLSPRLVGEHIPGGPSTVAGTPPDARVSPRDIVASTRPLRRAGAEAGGFAGTGALALPGCALAADSSGVPGASAWSRPNLAGRLVELSGQGGAAVLTAAMRLVVDAQGRGETTAWVTTRESSFFPPDAAQAGVELEALAVIRVPDARLLGHAAERLVRCGAFGLVVVDLAGASAVASGSVAPKETSDPTGPSGSSKTSDSSKTSAPMGSVAAAGATSVAREPLREPLRDPLRDPFRGVPSLPAGVAHRSDADVPLALLTRLLGLAERHDTVVLFLTEKAPTAPSLGSLVSLRAEARRERVRRSADASVAGAASVASPFASPHAPASGTEFLCEIASLRDRRRPSGWSEREVRRGPDGLR